MGIYSTNRYSAAYNDFEVVAAEGYNGEIGAAIAMIEGYQNDMALFDGVIATDFQEAAMIHEGASESEVYALQEGALADAWDKLKEFFKKLIEKIKGIFHAFIAKFDSIFMKDSKAFYNKYSKDISKKSSWKGFKCKVKPVKDKIVLAVTMSDNVTIAYSNNTTLDDATKKVEDFDSETEFAKTTKSMVPDLQSYVNTEEEFKKEYMETVFDDEEIKDDWDTDDILRGYIGSVLLDNKMLSELEKSNKKLQDQIKKIISTIEKVQSDAYKLTKNDIADDKFKGYNSFTSTGDKRFASSKSSKSSNSYFSTKNENEIKVFQKQYELAHKEALVIQSVITAYTSVSVQACKEAAAQARRVFAAAVAFAPKNEAVFAAAAGDVAFYEACDLLDTMYNM